MDKTAFLAFLEHVKWLIDQGTESNEISYRKVQDTLRELDRTVDESLSTAKKLNDVRPCLVGLMFMKACMPTVPEVIKAPTPPPVVASVRVADILVTDPSVAIDSTPTFIPAATPPTVPTAVVTIPPRVAPRVACDTTAENRNASSFQDWVPTTPSSHKRPHVEDTQSDDATAQSPVCLDDMFVWHLSMDPWEQDEVERIIKH
ncbi:hypothetical protein GGI13_006629 [Coemansia sp. RSA 455]|nr:hypothetical protein GGI13_006629 [Coemansia sp. RSA 455]